MDWTKTKLRVSILINCCLLVAVSTTLQAQTNVLTYHNDNGRTGQNLSETVLTPANVNTSQFGKLYSVSVDGYVYAQPLVLTNVAIPGQGTHDVVYVATEHDTLYAIDARNGTILWQVSFINPAAGITTVSSSDVSCGDLVPEIGITSTPVIDPNTSTIYLVARTKENGVFVQRLHALDAATHAEKFGGPAVIQATVVGTGSGGTGSMISFDPLRNNQRAGLLLQNGHIMITWSSHCDNGPYHGWIMSYNAGTLAQEAVFSDSPNGSDGGVWMSGAAMAGDASFYTYFASGNGTSNGTTEFGDSIVKLNQPSSGSLQVSDWFTPYNQAALNSGDVDLGSGGVLLLPDLPAGSAHQQLLVEEGKQGTLYLIDRNNMGHLCSSCTNRDTQIVQEIQGFNVGMWSTPAYWNGNLYFGGAYDGGAGDYLKAYSFNAGNSGLVSTSSTSETSEVYQFSGPTPSVSSSGTTNGILWALDNGSFSNTCCQVLHAYDATNLASEFYNSNQASGNIDVPGGAVKFSVPTVANGRVYVGSKASFSIYGLFQSRNAAPTFSPTPGTYSSSQSISISDSSSGTTIYYTTDGSAPTTSSTVYSTPITVTATTTINAMAAGGTLSQSLVASATYTIQSQASPPVFSPAPGTYSGAIAVTLSDTSAGVTIYYTTNGSTPTTSSTVYSTPITVSATTTIKAMASGGGFSASPVASGTYSVGTAAISFSSGFTGSGMALNGTSTYNGTRLRLTNGGTYQAASAFFATPVNVQSFTNDFSFQLTSPSADGMTFTIQGNTTTALGSSGGGLGYGPDPNGNGGTVAILKSVAIKFDLYSNAGEGSNSTGLYTNGATPTTPAIDLTSSGVNLHSGDIFNVHMTYDGATLTMTITDASNSADTFTTSWPVNIPNLVGGNTAYAGFTAATGGLTATQDILNWTFTSSASGPQAAATPTFSPAPGTYSSAQSVTLSDASAGVTIYYTTNGSTPTTSSTVYSTPITVSATTTIKAMASGGAFSASAVASGIYTIQPPAATPTFSPAPGTYSSAQSVTLSDTSAGVTIYYTTNGNTPTTSSTVYSTPITVSATTTIKAMASGGAFSASAVASGIYTIQPPAATPTFSPAPGTYSSAQSVTLSDTSAGVTIYYTTNGNTPTTSSTVYSTPITVSATTTIKAMASGGAFSASPVASGTYTIQAAAATPTFSPAPGTYSSAQSVTLSDTSAGVTIYYTTNGSTPTTSSTVYSTPITVSATTTIKAMASGGGFSASPVASGTYSVGTAAISFSSGFTGSGMALNGTSTYNGTRLRLTNGGTYQAASAFFATPVNVQSFTNDFSFQLTSPSADGMTFTIQGNTTTALGSSGGGLGYGPDPNGNGGTVAILKSVAIKFDLYSNAGEGSNSTGLYTNGATPTTPAIDLTSSGVNLHSGDIFNVHMTYDGATLTMTITDASNSADTFTTSWPVNIPNLVGGNTAYAGFTAATGGLTATQDILNWTFTSSASGPQAAATPTFSPAPGTYSSAQSVTLSDASAGVTIYYTTNGSTPTTSSTVYSTPITVSATTTIKAMASGGAFSASAVASGIYTIQPPAATPTFSPAPGTYSSAQSVTLSDTSAGVTIYYTTNGNTPTTSSTVYSTPITVSATTTIKAMASGGAFSASPVASGTYTIQAAAATPTFSPAPGTYSSAQSVTLSDTSAGVTIYYTTNGSTPTTSSTVYSTPITVSATTTIKAMASGGGFSASPVASGTYSVGTAAISFSSGFTGSGMALNGTSTYNGTRLRLTNGGTYQAASAFFATPVNVQSFTNDFSFQLTSPSADGMTFTIQGNTTTALGSSGGGLGYGPDPNGNGGTVAILKSVAIKFDLYSNAGEGSNSTGLYTNGATPTTPAIDLTSSGVNLHSGDIFNVHMTYDGATLTMTITDASNSADTFTTSWPVNIPNLVGGNTAYAGFTAATGGLTATQDILNWTF